VTHVALFHSVYGLRPAVVGAAELLRSAGHHVIAPDLFGGPVARTIEEGFAISERVGWPAIVRRAREAVRDLPPDAVLAGLSMGCGVVGELLTDRPETGGLLLLNGYGGAPGHVRDGLPIQLHVGDDDSMFPPAEVAGWQARMAAAGAVVERFRYPGVGHFFTDPEVPDADPAAAEAAWQRGLRFLAECRSV
jgi:dienelactone hydrolase